MAAIKLDKFFCHNSKCKMHGKFSVGNITNHGFYATSSGRRRRLICKVCKTTFSTTKGSAYYRIQKPKQTFDNVIQASVEGTTQSSNSRINRVSRSTVSRWLLKATNKASQYMSVNLKEYSIDEVQADEIRTFVGNKSNEQWIFAILEVGSRLWGNFKIGKRTFQNTLDLFDEFRLSAATLGSKRILFTTDGFNLYKSAIYRSFGFLPIYAQVIKAIRKNRVVKVEEKLIYGTKEQLQRALENSPGSSKINTSYRERLNLTIRQSLAQLSRKSLAHSRCQLCLNEQLTIFQCYYNFVRSHSSLKMGNINKTPAMEAGIAKRRITFREIFSVVADYFCNIFKIRMRLFILYSW